MWLPQLNVLREGYCSQDVADIAIGWVQSHRPELIEKLMFEEHWRQQAYSEAAWNILDYLTQEDVEIPTTLIGRMDLIAELTRRGRIAYGKPEIPPSGRPIAPAADQPLPPIPFVELSDHTKRGGKVTQEMADRVLRIAYETKPDLWIAAAEEQRYEIFLDATGQFQALIRQILEAEYPGQNNMWPSMYLYHEGVHRMYRMCGIEK